MSLFKLRLLSVPMSFSVSRRQLLRVSDISASFEAIKQCYFMITMYWIKG